VAPRLGSVHRRSRATMHVSLSGIRGEGLVTPRLDGLALWDCYRYNGTRLKRGLHCVMLCETYVDVYVYVYVVETGKRNVGRGGRRGKRGLDDTSRLTDGMREN
jgi:hypothetical protein